METAQNTAAFYQVETLINQIQPSEVLVKCTNYLQCIRDGKFEEYQKCYITNSWYHFKTTGKANNPVENIVKYVIAF